GQTGKMLRPPVADFLKAVDPRPRPADAFGVQLVSGVAHNALLQPDGPGSEAVSRLPALGETRLQVVRNGIPDSACISCDSRSDERFIGDVNAVVRGGALLSTEPA